MIYVSTNGEVVAIDSRPSDAIALALRVKAPIFVEEEIITKAKTSPMGGPEELQAEHLQRWLESLEPDELGKYKM